MEKQNLTGKKGEEEARRYLIDKGYNILHSNWRWKYYELDIVAENETELIIVEVKTRSSGFLVSPEESVDRSKIKRTVAAADVYVRQYDVDKIVRFDIISVIKKGETYTIDHIEDAFYAPLTWKRR